MRKVFNAFLILFLMLAFGGISLADVIFDRDLQNGIEVTQEALPTEYFKEINWDCLVTSGDKIRALCPSPEITKVIEKVDCTQPIHVMRTVIDSKGLLWGSIEGPETGEFGWLKLEGAVLLYNFANFNQEMADRIQSDSASGPKTLENVVNLVLYTFPASGVKSAVCSFDSGKNLTFTRLYKDHENKVWGFVGSQDQQWNNITPEWTFSIDPMFYTNDNKKVCGWVCLDKLTAENIPDLPTTILQLRASHPKYLRADVEEELSDFENKEKADLSENKDSQGALVSLNKPGGQSHLPVSSGISIYYLVGIVMAMCVGILVFLNSRIEKINV